MQCLPPTVLAVMCSRRFHSVALLAPPHPITHLELIILFISALQSHLVNPPLWPWIGSHSAIKRREHSKYAQVEPYCFCPAQWAWREVVEENLRRVSTKDRQEQDKRDHNVFDTKRCCANKSHVLTRLLCLCQLPVSRCRLTGESERCLLC